MMGERQGRQERLFYEFCLEDRIPSDHLLRKIDKVLDLGWLRVELAPFYSHTGRPSVDPELMIRMLIVGYCYSIRSERRLCRELDLNLAYRWFCRLGLEDAVPDHSTFSVNRHGRFRESATFRRVFETVVRACMAAGLVGGEGFAVDASVIEADASRFNRVPGGTAIDWTDEQQARRPIAEYLAALDSETPPTNPERAPKAISPSDPCAAWTTRGRFKAAFAYSLNCLIDLEEAVIVDVAATPTRISKEVDATETMLERTEDRFGLKPQRIAADVAYGTGEMLGWLVKRDIEPHIPVWERSEIGQEGRFSRNDFSFDAANDLYICPNGKALRSTGRIYEGTTLKYRAKKSDCTACPLRPRCTLSPERSVNRDVNEDARDYVRSLMASDAYRRSVRERKKIEHRFAETKTTLGLTRLRLRGLTGATDEFLLAAIVQNLKRLAKTLWTGSSDTVAAGFA
ncbi:MAG TPA: IS1182 family transposase [Rhodospirillales bacterium]|nr:IS1182 family transposase [Rhodospirillales bacterium]